MLPPSVLGPDSPAHDALRLVLEGTASEIGEGFFRALVQNLARALESYGAWITEYDPQTRRLRALAFRMGEQFAFESAGDLGIHFELNRFARLKLVGICVQGRDHVKL